MITIPKMASQALQKIAALKWQPQIFLGAGNSSTRATLKPGGYENAQGVIAVMTRQDPGSPLWADQPDMKAYKSFLDKYVPNADRADDLYAIGYSIAATTEHLIRQCGDVLTRENVMWQASNLKNFASPLLIPGITMNTTPTDYVPLKQFQLMRFKDEAYERLGILMDASQT